MNLGCTLSINVAVTDIPHMMMIVPHLVKMSRYKFAERTLIADTTPLASQFRNRPDIGTVKQLLDNCNELKNRNIIDSVIEVDLSQKWKLYRKYFGRGYLPVKSYRGCPIFHFIYGIEKAKTDYVLHFDSDMLFYQKNGHDYFDQAIELIRKNPDVMCVLPLSGPPREDKTLHQRKDCPYFHDNRGFYAFKEFTSRKYLISKQRLQEILPLKFKRKSLAWNDRVRKFLNGQSNAQRWEFQVTNALKSSSFIRADLDSPNAWTLHIKDRGEHMVKALPEIIRHVEAGRFPSQQAGHYDLNINAFRDLEGQAG